MTTTPAKNYYDIMNKNAIQTVERNTAQDCPIPEAHNRNFDEWVAEQTFARCSAIANYNRKAFTDDELIGKEVLFLRRENIGSKKWSDNRNILHSCRIEKVTEKTFFTDNGMRVSRSDKVIIGE